MGPGFESQVPQMPIIIFSQVIQCKANGVVHHTPSDPKCQMASRPNLMAQNERPPCALVNRRTRDHEKLTRLAQMGL